jgi:hypothetical protein
VTLPVSSPQDWQDLLDEKFPQGAQVNYVEADGSLSEQVYNVPYIVVLEMLETGPLLRGIQFGTDRDLSVPVTSWDEKDDAGHVLVRVGTVDGFTLEFSNWLSESAAFAMTAVRPEHTQALQEISSLFQSGGIVPSSPSPAVPVEE